MTTYPDFVLRRINESFNLYQVADKCYVSALIDVPEGFVTDFASIPRVFWSILPPHGAAMPASVVHDYYYTEHPIYVFAKYQELTTPWIMQYYKPERERLVADQEFRKNLIAAGISKFQAEIMYRAVRLFGAYRFKHYGKSRKTVRHERKIKQNRQEKGV